jgi:hypothetical protein
MKEKNWAIPVIHRPTKPVLSAMGALLLAISSCLFPSMNTSAAIPAATLVTDIRTGAGLGLMSPLAFEWGQVSQLL